MPIIFDGIATAFEKETELKKSVADLHNQGVDLKIAAILFREDAGSVLYTRLKKEAAARVGIAYETHEFSMTDDVEVITSQIQACNSDPTVTGIILQKPWKKRWLEVVAQSESSDTGSSEHGVGGDNGARSSSLGVGQTDYTSWWHDLVISIDPAKDVDGLHPQTLAAVESGTWREENKVLPATCQAVLDILDDCRHQLPQSITPQSKFIIIGKSDLLGVPLLAVLQHQGYQVELLRHQDFLTRLASGQKLTDADIVISATGQPGLITGDLLKQNAVVIDVGEPRGDVGQQSVSSKASFLTPVPGGVGPMTVVCLLENAVKLGRLKSHRHE